MPKEVGKKYSAALLEGGVVLLPSSAAAIRELARLEAVPRFASNR
jgi:hypothetical protein